MNRDQCLERIALALERLVVLEEARAERDASLLKAMNTPEHDPLPEPLVLTPETNKSRCTCMHLEMQHGSESLRSCSECGCIGYTRWKTNAELIAEEGLRCVCSTDPRPLAGHGMNKHEQTVTGSSVVIGKCLHPGCPCTDFDEETPEHNDL